MTGETLKMLQDVQRDIERAIFVPGHMMRRARPYRDVEMAELAREMDRAITAALWPSIAAALRAEQSADAGGERGGGS